VEASIFKAVLRAALTGNPLDEGQEGQPLSEGEIQRLSSLLVVPSSGGKASSGMGDAQTDVATLFSALAPSDGEEEQSVRYLSLPITFPAIVDMLLQTLCARVPPLLDRLLSTQDDVSAAGEEEEEVHAEGMGEEGALAEMNTAIGGVLNGRRIRFHTNSAVLTAEGRGLLLDLCNAIGSHPRLGEVFLCIEGHTCCRPRHNKGMPCTLISLSKARTKAVREALEENGLSCKFSLRGLGCKHPSEEVHRGT
jgi:hypothetical protein